MKRNFFRSIMLAVTTITLVGCTTDRAGIDDEPLNPSTGAVEISGNLSTQTLKKGTKYLIKGQTFVRNGQTLTIEPGTIIMGDKATKGTLIIDKGGKIMAEGTAAEPIVMTSALPAGSRDRGDWGGLVMLGNAPVNQDAPVIEGINPAVTYGGTTSNDNSGILKYVRVEFAGIELTPNNETNSITFGGIGSGTTVEYCQVSYGGDDGFEWFGGSVNAKHLISFALWDDSFDVDFGYSGKNQFGLEVRYPSFADQSGSNSFECDNGPNDNVTSFLTTGVFSNFTCIGPKASEAQSINANYQHSLDLRRRTAVTIANSVFMGYPRGLRMNQQTVYDNYNAGTGKLLNNIMVAPLVTYTGAGVSTANVQAYWLLPANGNQTITAATEAQFSVLGINANTAFGNNTPLNYPANPNFEVTGGSLASGASFSDSKLAGLQNVAYRGAFGSTDWTNGWAEFNPITKNY